MRGGPAVTGALHPPAGLEPCCQYKNRPLKKPGAGASGAGATYRRVRPPPLLPLLPEELRLRSPPLLREPPPEEGAGVARPREPLGAGEAAGRLPEELGAGRAAGCELPRSRLLLPRLTLEPRLGVVALLPRERSLPPRS